MIENQSNENLEQKIKNSEENEELDKKSDEIKSISEDDKDKEINSLKKELEKIEKESENFKDSWLRERAEFQNYKKRILQDIQNIKKNTIRQIVENILNPIDNLERITQDQKNITEELKSFLDGVEMIKKDFYSALQKENIFRVEPLNELFDPSKMEAISSEEKENFKEETVIEVYQPGYMIKEEKEETILRPSRVKIAKPK